MMQTGFIFAVLIPLVIWIVTVLRRYNVSICEEIVTMYTRADLVSLFMLTLTGMFLRVIYTTLVWEWLCIY